MGMLCEVNSILKLSPSQGYPKKLTLGVQYQACKEDYRILLVDVPILLVDEHWTAYADVIIEKLIWENKKTTVFFKIDRVYETPFLVKEVKK
jgi:hypothetical protein